MHRERDRHAEADRFHPDAWVSGAAGGDWAFNHLSHGPQGCPGSDLVLCVVEESNNILPVEKTHSFNGRYHVLMGSLSPLKGVTPDQLAITSLLQRLQSQTIEEVIVATNPNVEGETTALYLSRLIKPLGIRVTRLALGLPVGGDLEYADEVTMAKALEGRREL